MLKHKYKSKGIDWKKQRKSVAIPNQSMHMKEILARFVKGLPIDVEQKQGVYLDQVDHDFDRMARLDATEKAFAATQFAEEAEIKAEEIKAHERAKHERNEKAKIDAAVKKASEKQKAEKTDPSGSEK